MKKWMAAAAVVAFGTPGFAQAAEVAALRCARSPQDMQEVQRAEGQILAGFDTASQQSLLRPREVQARTQPRAVDDRVKEANELAEKGRAAYRKLELDAGRSSLTRAQAALRKLLPWLEDTELADILLDLGLIQIESGDAEAAVKTFRLARFYGAPRALDPRFFPEPAMKAYAKGAARAEASGMGTLAIHTDPPGAEIFLDGRRVGIGPRVVDHVVAGDHFVRIRAADRKPVVRKIQVSEGHSHRVTLRAPEHRVSTDLALSGDPDRDFQRQLAYGESVGSPFVLAYGQEEGSLFVRAIDVDRGVLLFHQSIPTGSTPAEIRGLAQDASAAVDAAAIGRRDRKDVTVD